MGIGLCIPLLYQKLRESRREREYERLLEPAFGKGYDLQTFRGTITERFDAEELRTLCFDLDVDYDSLRGEGKAGKARELVAYLARQDRLDELIAAVQRARPDLAEGFGSKE